MCVQPAAVQLLCKQNWKPEKKTTWSDAAANCLSKQTADIDVLKSYYYPQIYPPSQFDFYSPLIFIFFFKWVGGPIQIKILAIFLYLPVWILA